MRAIFILLATCCFGASFYSCHKKSNTGYIDSISISGCAITGNTLSFFLSSGNPNPTITNPSWDFGDGTTTTTVTAQHVYNNAGTYTVTLLVNGETLTKCITIVLPAVSPYTAGIAGTRTWHGTSAGMVQEVVRWSGTTPVIVDTAFAITVINPGTIFLPFFGAGLTLTLNTIDTTAKILTFIDCTSGIRHLNYYYAADSIVYSDVWYGAVGHGYETLVIHSP